MSINPGEATARDGLRYDDPTQAVSNEMHLLRTGLRQRPLHLENEPIGELFHQVPNGG